MWEKSTQNNGSETLSKSRLQKYTQTGPDQSIKQMIELNIIYIFSVHCFIYSKLKVSLTFRQSVLWFNTIVLSFFQLSKNSQMFFSSNSWLIRIRNLYVSVALAFSHACPQIFSPYSPGFVYKHKSLPDWRYISQNIYCIDSISLYSQICT